MKNKKIVVMLILIVIMIAIGLVIFINSRKNTDEEVSKKENEYIVPIEEEEKEEKVKDEKAKEIFDFIPKIYNEAVAPFSEEFKLYAVMDKIINENKDNEDDTFTFSEGEVNRVLAEIFGPEESLDKLALTESQIQDSIYYYSEELQSYTVRPVGFEGVYLEQILKEVTETKDNYYLYTYCLNGEYEFNYETGEIKAVIGDKAGEDLVMSFTENIDSNLWVKEYKDKLPVFRYTLKKDEDKYYIVAVEQVN